MSKWQWSIIAAFLALMVCIYCYLGIKAYKYLEHRYDPDPIEQKVTYLGTHTVTFYCSNVCQPGRPCLTATSTQPQPNRTVAVDPRHIPLGSKIHVDGFGILIAEDTGGAIKGKKLDIYTATCHEARQNGTQYLAVHLIEDIDVAP